MTLLRGLDIGWFEIKTDQTHELKLLDEINFNATPVHNDNGWSDHMTQLIPKISTPTGLVMTNFTSDKDNHSSMPGNDSVSVNFKVAESGKPAQEPETCRSGFF